jgi:hypothetical protein
MTYRAETPFDSIEGAQEYIALLAAVLEEADRDVHDDIALADGAGAERRLAALRLVAYKLTQLREHLGADRRILNDLRILRRLLLAERDEAVAET